MNNYALRFFAGVSLLWTSLVVCPPVLLAGSIDVAEGETVTVTVGNIGDFTLGSGNYLNDLGVITAEENTFLFESTLSPVAVVIDSATGEVRFENVGTINATNADGNACGVFNNTSGITIRVDETATGTITATASKADGAEQTYAQGLGGTYSDRSTLVATSFNIDINSTANGNESAYTKGLRFGVVDIGNLVGSVEAQSVSENSDAVSTAVDCRTSGTFGTITGDITAIAVTHNAAMPVADLVDSGEEAGLSKDGMDVAPLATRATYLSSFGIYGASGVSIDTLDSSSTIKSTTYSDTLNSPEGATSYRNLYSYGIETWSGDITINQLDGTIDVLSESTVAAKAATKGIWARYGDLVITDMTGTVKAVADSDSSVSSSYAIGAYGSTDPETGNLTLTSSGVIEAIAPDSAYAIAIYSSNVGTVTLQEGAQVTGQIRLNGDNSSLTMSSGSTLTNHGNSDSWTTIGAYVNGAVTNEGAISVTGKNATGVYVNGVNNSLVNTGTITADGASNIAIHVQQGAAINSGTIVASNGATACQIESDGILTLTGNSTNSISGEVEINSGEMYVAGGKWTLSELTAQEGSVIAVRKNAKTESEPQLNVGTLSLQGGTLYVGPESLSRLMLRAPLPSSPVQNPEDASSLNISSFATLGTVDGHLVAGRNSILSMGTANSQKALTAINDSGLWGESGVTAALYLAKPYTLTSGASLVVDGSLTYLPRSSATSDITFGPNSLLTIDASSISEGQAVLSSPSGTFTVDASAYLQVLRAKPGELKIVEFESIPTRSTSGGWSLNNILLHNVLLYPVASSTRASGLLTIGQISSADVFNAKGSTASFLDSYTSAGMTGSLATAGERFMDSLLSSTASDAAFMVEKAANLSGLGGVAHTAFDVTNTSRSLTSKRIPASGSSLMYKAQYLGEHMNDIYVTPMYQYTRVDSISTGHYSNSFTTNIYGLAIGAETANADWLLGAAVNFGKADTDGSKASSSLDTDNDYVSVLAYGAYILPQDFQIKGELIYVNLDSDVSGGGFSGDVDSNVYGGGIECSRPIPHKSVVFTPYLGLNYAYFDQDSYTSKNSDGELFDVKSADMSTWLLPLGVTMTRQFELDSGWRFNANVDAGVTFGFGDTDVGTKARLSGSAFNDDVSLHTDVVDEVTGNLKLGFAAEKGPFTFELDLNGNISEHSTYRGAMLKCAFTF